MKGLHEEYRYYLGDVTEKKIDYNQKSNDSEINSGLGVLDLFNSPNNLFNLEKNFPLLKK